MSDPKPSTTPEKSMSDAEAVKLVRDWLDSKEGTVDTKAIRRVCPDCDHNIECADRWKSEYDKLRASQSGSTAHRLAVLQEAAQYAVNRLDADKNQPQVAGDLSVALACSKAPLSAEQPNAQPQGPDLPGGDGVTRVTRTTAIRRDGTQSGPAAAAPFDKHCAICGQSLRPNCGETLCPIINATGGPCPVMEPASSGDVDTAMWVKVEEYNRVVSELHALRTRSSTGLTCPHGTIGYCEPCALVDPGELGETPPRLVHSSTGEPPQDWQDIFTEYARYGRSDAWLYQQIEAHSRRATRSAIALPVMELRAAALGLLQAWNKSEREGISVAEMAKARQRVDAAIRATAPSHTAPEAVESFTVEVCDALFGCFVCPAEEDMFRCACCDWPIPITGWIHADHDEGCLIPRVRAYLAQHKPEAVPSPQRYETKEKP